MSDLPATEVTRAVTFIEVGHTYRSVSEMLGISVSVIHRNVKRYRQTGSYVSRWGQGRNRATSVIDERLVRVQTLINCQTAVQTRNLLRNVRVKTNSRRLNQVGLKSYVPAKVCKLQVSYRVARLSCARQHQD